MSFPNRKRKKEYLAELKGRFESGETLSINDIVDEYFNPRSTYNYLVSQKVARGWIATVKRHFRRNHGLWFGCVDQDGNYGVITTEEEVKYAMTRYYKYIEGAVNGARILYGDANSKGLLPSGMVRKRMLVAKLEEDEDK